VAERLQQSPIMLAKKILCAIDFSNDSNTANGDRRGDGG
jgi:hypothetical protein